MPRSFDVSASSGSYQVSVGTDLLEQVVHDQPQAIFIVDRQIENRLPAGVTRRIVIDAVESNKSLEYAPQIIKELRRLGADRTSHLVAVGGGIIQDIVTFAASIFMRGVPWTYVPTTLLSMVDSCIGGKSSINAAGYKNLVGNFYPPGKVLVDVSFITTLDAEMIVGGLFEAAKICYASSYACFLDYLAEKPSATMTPRQAQHVILHSLRTKKWFIETDEFDKKERLLLNFGHTFGHAIEAGTSFGVSHGIGVGLGMLVANEYARQHGELTDKGSVRARHLGDHIKTLLGAGAALVQVAPPGIDLDQVMDKFDHDKKHHPASYRIVIPRGDGQLELISLPRSEKVRRDIVAAFEVALGQIPWPLAASQHAA